MTSQHGFVLKGPKTQRLGTFTCCLILINDSPPSTFFSFIIVLILQYSCCSLLIYARCTRLPFAYMSLHYASVVFNKTVKGEQYPTCPLKPFLPSVIDSFFCLRAPLGMLVFISWLHLPRSWRHPDTDGKTSTQANYKQILHIPGQVDFKTILRNSPIVGFCDGVELLG